MREPDTSQCNYMSVDQDNQDKYLLVVIRGSMEEPNDEQDEPVVIYLTVERLKQIMMLTSIVDWATRLLYAIAIFYLGKTILFNEMYLTPDIVAVTAIAFLIRRYMEYLANVKFYGIYLAVLLFVQNLKEKI